MALLALAAGSCAWAQDPGQEPTQEPSPEPPPAAAPEPQPEAAEPPAPVSNLARAVVRGVVKNAASGQPIPRALVRIEGDATSGALTDGDGQFEIAGVPLGPQAFQVMKPGFVDPASAASGMGGPIINGAGNSEHNVYVTADMPEVAFALAPTNAIVGTIELSTGDPAPNIAVMLLRRGVQDGRLIWQPLTNVRSNSEGAYRFAGLTDGTYALFTEPAMDSDVPAAVVKMGGEQAATGAGYRSVFYPDATDVTGAAKIQVSGGEQTQANFLLTEEPFHQVRAGITLPHGNVTPNVNITVLDGQGHQLSYPPQYDPATRTVQTFLPDGTYALQVTAVMMAPPSVLSFSGSRPRSDVRIVENRPEGQLIGRVEFSVAGHAVTHLQIPLTAQHSNTIQVSVIRSGKVPQASAGGSNGNQPAPIVIMLSQAGGSINDGMVTSFAEGYATGPIETSPDIGPGSYWVHTNIPQKTLCEASFTAGGASLGREPLVLSLAGVSSPLTLTLRDDCASLKISLPNEADVEDAGEEPYYTIYAVPDFDSTTDIMPVVLRPSSGGSATLDGLTPGSYHVYTFDSQVQLQYRNPEAMAAIANHAQAITLDAGTTASLVVEVPKH
jgi:hypothetical protein